MKKLLVTGYVPEDLISIYKEKFDITMPDKQKDRFTLDEVKAMIGGYDALFTLYAFPFREELISLDKFVIFVLKFVVLF